MSASTQKTLEKIALTYDGKYRHYSHIVDTDDEVTERYNYRRQKTKQAKQAKANQPLIDNWKPS